jgi:hypothetical protein
MTSNQENTRTKQKPKFVATSVDLGWLIWCKVKFLVWSKLRPNST